MAHGAHREEWVWEGSGVPLLVGMLIAISFSAGLWLMLSYAGWLVLR